MGRKSKLNEKEWDDVARRIEAGESCRSVAASYGVAESSIRARINAQKAETAQIKTLAHQLVTAENKIKALPIAAQITAHTLADELRAISMHLASAGKYNSATAHRLAAIAHAEVQKLDDVDPLSDAGMETIKNVAVLTRTANEASEIPVNLLKANKETAQGLSATSSERPINELTDAELLAIAAGGG